MTFRGLSDRRQTGFGPALPSVSGRLSHPCSWPGQDQDRIWVQIFLRCQGFPEASPAVPLVPGRAPGSFLTASQDLPQQDEPDEDLWQHRGKQTSPLRNRIPQSWNTPC